MENRKGGILSDTFLEPRKIIVHSVSVRQIAGINDSLLIVEILYFFLSYEILGFKTLELWDMKGEKRTTQHAHEELISCLAASNTKGLVASAGYDKCIKIWE